MTTPPLWTRATAYAKQQCRLTPAALALGLGALLAAAPSAGAASYTWNVQSGNWSDPNSWTPTPGLGGPLAGDAVVFGPNDTSSDPNTPNNIVDAGFAGTVSNLTYNATSPTAYNVTQIGPSQTLRVAGPLLAGGVDGVSTAVTTEAYMTGGGSLVVTKGSLTVQNYNTGANVGSTAFLNLAGLSTFIYSNQTGTVSVEDNPSGKNRLGGNLILAGVSNVITATNMNLGTSTSPNPGPMGSLTLGPGTNIFNVAILNVVNNKSSFTISNLGGGLRIRGVSGAENSRATITIGNRNVTSSTGADVGNLFLNGCMVNIMANTLVVGETSATGSPSSATGLSGTGVLQFDNGVIDATNVVMGNNVAANSSGLAGAYSTVTVGYNAALRIGTGGLTLLNQTASNVVSSTLTISNGIVICNGNITVTTNAAAGSGTAAQTNTINILGSGTLALGAGCLAGTTNSPIGNLYLDTGASLRFTTPPANGVPAMSVNNLTWPATDTGVTLMLSNLPSTATVGTVIPLVHFNNLIGGAVTAPMAILPSGATGTLSVSGNTIVLTINSSTYPYFLPSTFQPATQCTNTALFFVANSMVSTITNVQVIMQTNVLGGITNTTVTNGLGSAALTVSGLNTAHATITLALATNTIYNAITVKVTDGTGTTISQNIGQFDTFTPALVMEASDFNFGNGQFVDTPQNGGVALYTNQVGVQGVDENKTPRSATHSYYRTNDAVVVQAANPQLGTPPSLVEQKFLMAYASGDTLDVEQEVGYNSGGDWLNYTRTFGPGGSGPAGNYTVWCYLATSGSGPQIGFSQVTSDPHLPGQTTNFLGTFGTASFSDSGYNNFVYVPLVDQYGNRVTVTVGNGPQTFKATVVGNPNIASYIFMPVQPVFTPQVLNLYPDGKSSGLQSTNKLTFTVGPAQGAPIDVSGIQLIINGVDVTSAITFSQVGGLWTGMLTIQTNLLFTGTLNVTNTAGISTSVPLNFDTMDLNNFQWEAVDYDFSTNDGTIWHSGLFIDNPVPTGDTNAGTAGNPYATGSPLMKTNSYNWYPTAFDLYSDPTFNGAVALIGVDAYYTNATGMQSIYRNDSTYLAGGTQYPPVVGTQIASDNLNGGLRRQFLLAQTNTTDLNICEFNIGWFNTGFWLNYTRTYPTGKFNVWGRLAGGAGAFSGTTLSLVTGGVGTSNQTTQVLGTFADAAPAGWQTYHWVPLLDTNGNKVTVTFNGKATLKLTSGNNLNPLFFMLTPALTQAPFTITSSGANGNVLISFPTSYGFNYTVWQSTSLAGGSWTQVGNSVTGDGLVHTVTQPAGTGQVFYRVLAQ